MKKNIIFYIILSVLASALNYFAYPMLARLLPDSQYVDITVSLSLMTQISAFMSALTAVTIGITKKGPIDKRPINQLQTSLLQIFTLIGFVFLVLSPLIFPIIDTPAEYALAIVIMILVSIPITIISGYLNGKGSMVKLGSVALLTASLQFITGGFLAATTHSGLVTMTAMGLVQILSIILLVKFLNEPNMPKLGKDLFSFNRDSLVSNKLLKFTIVSAFAIMAINLLQVFDLLIIKNIGGSVARFYTDVYVISRVVFFAGTIFIWPFLASISLHDKHVNRRAFLKLIATFSILTLGAIIVIFFFGNTITNLMFGKTYDSFLLWNVLSLSILYKMFFLVITASCLFVISQHNYRSTWLALATSIVIVTTGILTAGSMSMVLASLAATSGVMALVSFLVVWLHRPETDKPVTA